MIYSWQLPSMLMSWSWIFFLLAMTLTVVAPLGASLTALVAAPVAGLVTAQEKRNDRKVAIFYLATSAVVVMNFVWSSFWCYRVASLTDTSR